jgi:hypothetical protein
MRNDQEVAVGMLSTRACQDNRCGGLLKEVDDLTGDIFDSRMDRRFRFYERLAVFLSDDHAKAVEETLDALIFGRSDSDLTKSSDSFDPSPRECMYLVAATRLRCLGLLWGLFPKTEREPHNGQPSPNDDTEWNYDNSQPTTPNWIHSGRPDAAQLQNLIETFPRRSSKYLRDNWHLKCSWSVNDKGVLCSILNSYLPNAADDQIPEKIGEIRIRTLAYLLRVATSCTIGKGVRPLEIRLKMKPDSCCDMRKTHLACVDWIHDTIFDHGRNTVEFRASIPAIQRIPDPRDGSSLPIAYVDYAPGLQFLGSVIQGVLDTALPHLEGFANTCMRTVKMMSYHLAPDALKEGEAYLPDHWALPLAAAVNAAEIAGMTALVLRSFCKYGFHESGVRFSEQVAQVCQTVERMHPCNALIRQLVAKIKTDFPWDREPNKQQIAAFELFLDEYLVQRADASDRVADEALNSEALTDTKGEQVDFVIMYGYGRCVMSTLVKGDFWGEVLLIDVADQVRGRWVNQEPRRVVETLDSAKIKYRKVRPTSLRGELRRGKAAGKTFAFLTGTRCVLRETGLADQFLCPDGTWLIATTVNACGGKTVALAELEKLVSDDAEIADIRMRLRQIAAEFDDRPWVQVDPLEDGTDITTAVIA